MWSPYHNLYVIRKDKFYSVFIKTAKLKGILNSLEGIISTGNCTYRNRVGYPTISIVIVHSDKGNFAIQNKHTTFNEINHIEIEVSKKDEQKNWYLEFMMHLASQLSWELILLEEDETLIWKS